MRVCVNGIMVSTAFPRRAAHIVVQALLEETGSAESVLQRVIFCCFGDESRRLHEEALAALGPSR